MRRPTRLAAILVLLAALAAACGDDDDGGTGAAAEQPSAGTQDGGGDDGGDGGDGDLPEECADGPLTVSIAGGEALPGVEGPEFEATSSIVAQQPIVLDPEEGIDIEEAKEAAAETDLIAYTVYVADFPLDDADAATLGFADPPPGGTYFAFSIVPPTEEPIAEGDVIRGGKPAFESQTTFGNVGTQYGTAVAEDAPRLSTDGEAGEVEVLHLDDERICLSWSQEGTLFGGGADATSTWSVDGAVVGGRLAPRAMIALS